MTCGDFCTQMVYEKMQISSTTITNGIDQDSFKAIPEIRVPNRVLVLSRKNYSDYEKISKICGEGVDFHVVDGLTQEELIKEYQKADIFLATGYPEGLPLPPLEAMLCGCVVVGFTGGGASEYMINGETALVAEDGGCDTASEQLKMILSNQELKERMRQRGMDKASTYTLENTKQMLKQFYEQVVF